MAKFTKPVLFSSFFGLDPEVLKTEGLIDPFLNVDTQLFIDPLLLEKSSFDVLKTSGISAFKEHFRNFVRLLIISEKTGDAAWTAAEKLLDLSEPPENGLGYGGSSRSGSSRPEKTRRAIMSTAKEIIDLGSKDPEMISLMGFFEDDVGPDTISDFTTRVIIRQLAEITEKFCGNNGVPLAANELVDGVELPSFLDDKGRSKSIVLVPLDIVRELPIANDWSDIEKAILANRKIRKNINVLLSSEAETTVADRKNAMRNIALDSRDNFELFLSTVKEHNVNYDPNQDVLGYISFAKVLNSNLDQFRRNGFPKLEDSPEALLRFVEETILHFKHHVEKGNLWEMLWVEAEPKKERAAQLLYFAIADCFCRANNIDISPEANMGGGPVDFKFSKGYQSKIVVELKKSTGAVKHGYEKQLEFYKEASRTDYGIFVVIDYGKLGKKLEQITSIQRQRQLNGERASKIIVIDATKKESASNRN